MANRRLDLLNAIDADFRSQFNDKGVNAYNGFYDDALALMKSKELKPLICRTNLRSGEQRTATTFLARGACSLADLSNQVSVLSR